MQETSRDLARTTLGVLFIGGMLVTCFYILGAFLTATVWAATLVIASFPLMLSIQSALWGRRSLAVAVMTFALLLFFVVPFWFAIGTIVRNASQIAEWARDLATFKMPQAPDWLAQLPFFGQQAAEFWDQAADMGLRDLATQLAPWFSSWPGWFVSQVGNLGLLFLQFLLTVLIAGIMYSNGEQAAAMAQKFGQRLAGERGREATVLAAKAIRGVALAVVVTAVTQTAVGGVAMGIAGVPFASVLSALMLMMCVAQLGPAFVLIPAVIWLYATGSVSWGTFLLVVSVVVISLDNLLRPMLIKRGANLPMLLILAGVIGGLLAFGLVGVFLGPAVLAVSYTLLQQWMAEDEGAAPG